jgi:7-cyano-7-deazaguanine reductase
MPVRPSKRLETFRNPAPGRDYRIHMEIPEFTCLCPVTGQPDFATLVLDYVPDRLCVELKSLKLYVWSYRNEGAFHEAVTNRVLDDIVKATRPRYARGAVQRPRRDFHDRRRGAPQAWLEAGCARRPPRGRTAARRLARPCPGARRVASERR